MANIAPVFVKDAYANSAGKVYIPADSTGTYWTRWDIGWVGGGLAAYSDSVAVEDVWYGKVHPGQTVIAGGAGWSETGVALSPGSSGLYSYRTTDLPTEVVEIAIPANYNYIVITCMAVAGSTGLATIDWNDDSTDGIDVDGSGTNTLTLSGSIDTVVEDHILATNSPGGKTLRIAAQGTGSNDVRIVGVKAYNTNAIGDPSTAASDIATGHDMVTVIPIGHNRDNSPLFDAAVNVGPQKVQNGQNKALLWAFDWAPAGSALLFCGSDSHFGAGENTLVWDAAWATDGMTILVDGVDKGEIWNLTSNPLQTLWTGDAITFKASGYSDYNNAGGAQADADPSINVLYSFGSSGVSTSIDVTFKASTDTSTIYCPITQCFVTGSNTFLFTPPDDTKTTIIGGVTGNLTLDGFGAVEYYPENQEYFVRMNGNPPASNILWQDDSSDKLYVKYEAANMAGGINPQVGDIYNIGGMTQIMSRDFGSVEAIGSTGGRGYRSRYSG